MIEIILYAALCAVAVVLGHVLGFRRGYNSCLDNHPVPSDRPGIPSPFPLVEGRMSRYSFRLTTPNAVRPEDRIRIATSAVDELSTIIARRLLAEGVIRPVILEPHIGGRFGDAIEIGASLYALADPAYDRYPKLVYFTTPLNPD
ncbi:hypothetical protein [uncultured Duncaniella sp.]|uniref:hypothetical protein n=2 Tax=uncultured Duncaniella sp. TaxID=2768039 RepID=UPI00272C446B|nr:hypothetical protein [uncultured Duncaniella sp.]